MIVENETEVLEYRQEGIFESKQIYEDETVRSLICKKCGGRVFRVGQGSYLTAIKCVTCRWETVIHDG